MPQTKRSIRRSALAGICLLACGGAVGATSAGQDETQPAVEAPAMEPIAAELREARTVVLLDTTMDFALSSRFRSALEEWGRFEIVYTPDEADVCMALSTRAEYTKQDIEAGGEATDGVEPDEGAAESEDPLRGRAVGTTRVMDKLYFRIFVPGAGDELWNDEVDVGSDDKAADALLERLRQRLEDEASAAPSES